MSPIRKKAKTEFLKVLYGGDIKLYSDTFNDVEGAITEEGYKVLKELENEVKTLMSRIWEKYPQFHKLKTDKEKKMICKKPNPQASLMSLVFQTEECKMLLIWDQYLTYIWGFVEKLEKETQFPMELLEGGSIVIRSQLSYDIKITQKEISHEWTLYKTQVTQYDIMKREFEKNNFLIGSQICSSILHNGNMIYMKKQDAVIKFMNKFVMDRVRVRLGYENVDFIPNVANCPTTTYNLFKTFNAEKYCPDVALTEDEITNYAKPILQHFSYLTSGNENYFIKLLGNIIQTPHIRK